MSLSPFDRSEPPSDEELLARLADEPHEAKERRRVRLCPFCEEAAWERTEEDATCETHGDPYEGPAAPELRFHALFGRFPWELPAVKTA